MKALQYGVISAVTQPFPFRGLDSSQLEVEYRWTTHSVLWRHRLGVTSHAQAVDLVNLYWEALYINAKEYDHLTVSRAISSPTDIRAFVDVKTLRLKQIDDRVSAMGLKCRPFQVGVWASAQFGGRLRSRIIHRHMLMEEVPADFESIFLFVLDGQPQPPSDSQK